MKKTNLIAILSAGIAVLAVSCSAPQPQTVEGTVADATMNNVMIVTAARDTINVSTMDADPAYVQPVLVGEKVTVTYAVEKIEGGQILKATELVVTKHIPAYYIEGSWVEPNPINNAETQGFTLNADRTAASINMATLVYKTWQLDGEQLILGNESIGNKKTIPGADTVHIMRVDADSLIMQRKDGTLWKMGRVK